MISDTVFHPGKSVLKLLSCFVVSLFIKSWYEYLDDWTWFSKRETDLQPGGICSACHLQFKNVHLQHIQLYSDNRNIFIIICSLFKQKKHFLKVKFCSRVFVSTTKWAIRCLSSVFLFLFANPWLHLFAGENSFTTSSSKNVFNVLLSSSKWEQF